MNIPPLLPILFLCAGLAQADSRFEITARLIEAPESVTITADLEKLDRRADLLTAPRVTVSSGQQALISIGREFKVESGESVPVGLELEITVSEDSDGLSFIAQYELTEFDGFAEHEGIRSPRFSTVTIPFSGAVPQGVPYLFPVGPSKSDPRRCLHLTITRVNDAHPSTP